MKRFLILLSITISVIISIWTSLALNIPDKQWYILDQANILTTDQETQLESKIYQTRQDTDIEIWVLIINSLSWEDIFNYSLNVAESRWVGDKEKDNGLFMLFTMEDRERRIQVWYGLEWIITDSIAKRFWERNIPNNFRAWLYFDWINNTLDDIISYIKKDPTALAYINSENNSQNTDYYSNTSWEFNMMILIALFIALKMLVIEYDKKKKKTKIKKWWRIAFGIIGIAASIITYMFFLPWETIVSWLVWYGASLVILGILVAMWSGWGMWWTGTSSWFGWFSSWGGFSSGSSSGSSFGWFWGGSFWGGGGWWKR